MDGPRPKLCTATMEALIEELKKCIIENLELDDVTPEEVDADAPLFAEGLGLDSIDAVELVSILEKNYGIQVTEMETARAAFETVRTLASFITENQQKV
jgi:acyl carrier protein